MGKKNATRITAQDIAKVEGGLPALVAQLVKKATDGDSETKDAASAALRSLSVQNHGEHGTILFDKGAVKPLVQLLVRGSAKSQGNAAGALYALGQARPQVQEALVRGGGVLALVKLLKAGSAKVQEEAASALSSLTSNVSHQKGIIETGGIGPLVAMLKGGSGAAQASAAQALANAAAYSKEQAQDVIAKAGAIPLLLRLLAEGKAQTPAAHALANLAHENVAIQSEIQAANGIPPLLALLNGRSFEAQVAAAAALSEMARKNNENQAFISKAGGIGPLLALLSSRSNAAQSQGMAALAQLAQNNRENQDMIARMGGIKPLVHLLESSTSQSTVLSYAAFGLMEISRGNHCIQRAVVDAGGISALALIIKTAKEDQAEVKAEVAGALWSLSEDPKIKIVIAEAGTIPPLVQLLGNGDDRAREHASQTLASLGLNNQQNQIQITQLLIELLMSGIESAQQRAVHALQRLVTENPNSHEAIASAGNPGNLVELLTIGIPEAKDYAIWALSLSITEENQSVVAEAGGVQPLINQLSDRRVVIQHEAAAALAKLCANNDETRAAITKAGGVRPLIHLLDPSAVSATVPAAVAVPDRGGGSSASTEVAQSVTSTNDAEDDGKDTGSAVNQDVDSIRADAAPAPQEVIADTSHVKRLVRDESVGSPRSKEIMLEKAAAALANLALDSSARDEIVAAGGIAPLVTLLKKNGRNAKKFSATAMARLSTDHEATQSAIAGSGAILPLVDLLDGNEGPDAQEEAAGALYALADHERNRLAITRSDGIGKLVMLLGVENPRAREHAEGALVRLSIEDFNRIQIIKKLVYMLQDHHAASTASAQEQAAAALSNLARESEANRKSIVEAKGIPPLLALLDSAGAKAKENSVGAIKELCRNSKENQLYIAREGGIPKLVGVLLGFSGTTMKEIAAVKLCTLAASAIKEMAKGNRKNQDAISNAGAIVPLVAMLGSPAPQMQANAAGALANLARNHVDNQAAVAKTGAVAPLCTLVREGSAETKDESAKALWSLSSDNAPNKDMIAKLGGIDPLVGLLVSGTTEKSQICCAGALAALAAKHSENRQLIAKRLVGLLGSSAARAPDRAVRVLLTCSLFTSDSPSNQVAIAKGGGIPPLITWLGSGGAATQAQAAHALLCLAIDNATTQILIAKGNGIPPLISMVKRSAPATQEYAARALWHLASQAENQVLISDAGGIKPLVGMLSTEGENAAELAAIIMVRLSRANQEVSTMIAETGGIIPLVKLVTNGTPGGQQQAASALSELALVSKNRDLIADAGGIEPLIKLMSSPTAGSPETAARALAHLALEDVVVKRPERVFMAKMKKATPKVETTAEDDTDHGNCSAARRAMINQNGGIKRLVAILDGQGKGKGSPWGVGGNALDDKSKTGLGLPSESGLQIGLQEQASATLADIAYRNYSMQDAIIEANAVPSLLAYIRTGSQLGQEHAARAIWHLCALFENQGVIVECGTITELVQLLKTGSSNAQEVAAAGISDLARGAIVERQSREKATENATKTKAVGDADSSATAVTVAPASSSDAEEGSVGSKPSKESEQAAAEQRSRSEEGNDEGNDEGNEDGDSSDRLVMIADAGGILPLVALLNSSNSQARENSAGALWHLALDETNQVSIARCNGISPLVTILDEGTLQAHQHAADALARLAFNNVDNQAQIAKHLVALLGNPNAGAQQRAGRALRELAAHNPGSPVVIVNAGAISPLVNLLSAGAPMVKEEAAGALSTLSFNSPSTQLAIATGLVALVGTGTAEAQEHVTKLLLTLAHDPDNCGAIAKAGAIPRLVVQLKGQGYTSIKAQELAAAVLSNLSGDSDDNVTSISTSGGIRPLVALLSSSSYVAQAHSAAVLADMARKSARNQRHIIFEGGIAPLVALLGKDNKPKAKAEAAGALCCLCSGLSETQKVVADAGAIKLLVAILNESDDHACMKAAGAIAALCSGSVENQDAVEKFQGISRLVGLLDPSISNGVRAEASAALAVLARGNRKNQDKIALAGGIEPFVTLLQSGSDERAKEEAASALWALSAQHYENQIAVAKAGGIAPLVAVLGVGSVRAQEQGAGALAALGLQNTENESSIAKLIVSLLGSDEKKQSAKAARAISRLASAHPSNQASIACAGGVTLLVSLLDIEAGGVGAAAKAGLDAVLAQEGASVQREMASAIWSMTFKHTDNQIAVAQAGGIPPLIKLLDGNPEAHREAAGALWSLASSADNQAAIAKSGGVPPLVGLLKTGSQGAQETAAGALFALAAAYDNRVSIAAAGGISFLIALFDGGSEEAKEQASGALQTLVLNNVPNQLAVSNEAVAMLRNGSSVAQEYVTTLVRNLAQDPDNRTAIAKAGAVPELVRQLEGGSDKAMSMAASGLALIALKSPEHRALVTKELVKLLGSDNEAVRQRASEALRDMASDTSKTRGQKNVTTGGGAPLVNLLKDGLKDGRVEAQEYALWSLSSISDATAKEAIVQAGGINPLIVSLESGKLSLVAQEHAAAVLSGLAPLGDNALAIKSANGIAPLVQLLSDGNMEAKEHAATALAQLALRADAALEIARAGAVSAFVTWLMYPDLGPPEVAARALSEIALDTPDTQIQIAEEGAIAPLVTMVSTKPGEGMNAAQALKTSKMAAGALATLAKENPVNQVMITEEGGIAPLVELLKGKALPIENATKALWHLAAMQDNQTAIARAGGIVPLVALLASSSELTQQYASAALESLVRDHTDNQIALAKAGAIELLVSLLGSDSTETQVHSVGALLHLASNDEDSRTAVVQRLVALLDLRNAAAQMKACEALAVLAARTVANRTAITEAKAITPLVRLLGDGRRVRAETPQERAAAVLADLARSGENKVSIVEAGGVAPLVAMLSSEAPRAQTHAVAALWYLGAVGMNKTKITNAGAIPPLVALLASGTDDSKKFAGGALWHLTSSADNKVAMVNAGAIPPLVCLLDSKLPEGREFAAAVISTLARTQGGNKKAIVQAGGIAPLVALLEDANLMTQKHASCSLWGLSDGKDGIYDKQIVENGAIRPLVALLINNHVETRGFAAACLSCLCADPNAKQAILKFGGTEPLLALANNPSTWLRTQVRSMLELLDIPLPEAEVGLPGLPVPEVNFAGDAGASSAAAQWPRSPPASPKSPKAGYSSPPSTSRDNLFHTTSSMMSSRGDNPFHVKSARGCFRSSRRSLVVPRPPACVCLKPTQLAVSSRDRQ